MFEKFKWRKLTFFSNDHPKVVYCQFGNPQDTLFDQEGHAILRGPATTVIKWLAAHCYKHTETINGRIYYQRPTLITDWAPPINVKRKVFYPYPSTSNETTTMNTIPHILATSKFEKFPEKLTITGDGIKFLYNVDLDKMHVYAWSACETNITTLLEQNGYVRDGTVYVKKPQLPLYVWLQPASSGYSVRSTIDSTKDLTLGTLESCLLWLFENNYAKTRDKSVSSYGTKTQFVKQT